MGVDGVSIENLRPKYDDSSAETPTISPWAIQGPALDKKVDLLFNRVIEKHFAALKAVDDAKNKDNIFQIKVRGNWYLSRRPNT